MNKRFGFGVTAFYYIYNPPSKHYSPKFSDAVKFAVDSCRR